MKKSSSRVERIESGLSGREMALAESRSYFNGDELLFVDVRMAHRRLLAAAAKTVRFMNRMIEIAGEEFVEPPNYELPFRTFDIRAAKGGAKGTIRPIVKLMIDKVTAEVHAALDEDREAAAIYSRLNGIGDPQPLRPSVRA